MSSDERELANRDAPKSKWVASVVSRRHSLTEALLATTALGYLLAVAAGSRHLRFVFDDFEFAAGARRLGLLAQTKDAFFRFSGRTVLLVAGGGTAVLGPRWAAVIVTGVLLVLVAATTVVVHRVLARHTPVRTLTSAAAGLCFTALAIGSLPAREQVLYWLIGELVYVAPIALVMIGLCWATARESLAAVSPIRWWRRVSRVCSFVSASLCVALGAGGNESMAAATVCVFVVLAHLAGWRSHLGRRSLLMLPAAFIGAAVIYGAPGQRARAHWLPVDRTLDS
jgi:hypothetical protein